MTRTGAIDLHAHSNISDGTDTPELLVQKAHAAGLRVIALTDHDTLHGWQRASTALPDGLTLIPGVELSCVWHPRSASRAPVSVHMLGYMMNPEYPPLQDTLARLRISRYTRGQAIVELLMRDGIPVTWEEVVACAPSAQAVGRPHIAQVLMHHGVVSSVEEAFAPEWLGKKYRREKQDIDVFTALRLIRQAGGVTVIAHPLARQRGSTVPLQVLSQLAQMGLAGVEVDHADHTYEDRALLRAHATEHGLLTTGSSDYHGSVKAVQLGENATTTWEVLEELMARASGCAPVTASRHT